MRETCARVLAAALMMGAIASAVGLPSTFESASGQERGLTAPPSSLQRTVRVPAGVVGERARRVERPAVGKQRHQAGAQARTVRYVAAPPRTPSASRLHVRHPSKPKPPVSAPAAPPTAPPVAAPAPGKTDPRELTATTPAPVEPVQPPATEEPDADKGNGKGKKDKGHEDGAEPDDKGHGQGNGKGRGHDKEG
jgi:hypothetical protein